MKRQTNKPVEKRKVKSVKPLTVQTPLDRERIAALEAHAARINRPLSKKEEVIQFGGSRN